MNVISKSWSAHGFPSLTLLINSICCRHILTDPTKQNNTNSGGLMKAKREYSKQTVSMIIVIWIKKEMAEMEEVKLWFWTKTVQSFLQDSCAQTPLALQPLQSLGCHTPGNRHYHLIFPSSALFLMPTFVAFQLLSRSASVILQFLDSSLIPRESYSISKFQSLKV